MGQMTDFYSKKNLKNTPLRFSKPSYIRKEEKSESPEKENARNKKRLLYYQKPQKNKKNSAGTRICKR